MLSYEVYDGLWIELSDDVLTLPNYLGHSASIRKRDDGYFKLAINGNPHSDRKFRKIINAKKAIKKGIEQRFNDSHFQLRDGMCS
jgi:hypothetical protein